MTEAEAHKFVARWKRFFGSFHGETAAATARRIQQQSYFNAGCCFLIVIIAVINAPINLLGQALALFVMLACGFFVWMALSLYTVRRVLDQSQIVNPNS